MNSTSATTPPMAKRRRPNSALPSCSWLRSLTVLVATLATSEAFHTIPASTERLSTSLSFRNNHLREGYTSDAFFDTETIFSDSSPTSAASAFYPAPEDLPTWLAIPDSSLAEPNLTRLRDAMRTLFFTESEMRRLFRAIEMAAAGDLVKVAGAADFCLILVETMEMGSYALVAAAFHYCACFEARENPRSSSFHDGPAPIPAGLESFGSQSMAIAEDAGRLKHLERVAGIIMQSEGNHGRVIPDKKDADNLQKLLLSETKDWRALAIRSAACLYRLRGLIEAEVGLTPEAVRTAREALNIYAPLASRLGMHRLKNELEGAAFRILYRRQYERVTSASAVAEAMQQVLADVKAEMTDMLLGDAEFMEMVDSFSVTARVKEPYSMWKKMLRNRYQSILQVPDALALRVVLDAKKLSPDEPAEVTSARERALCYYVQTLCMSRWTPDANNPRFKDYIESPKQNGYQSLHYTARTMHNGRDWNLEIQSRSGEMHQIAEYGLASHWEYKATEKEPSKEEVLQELGIEGLHYGSQDQSSQAYLSNMKRWHWEQHAGAKKSEVSPFEPEVLSDIWQSRARKDRIRARTERLEPYIDALMAAQFDLASESVFVFLAPEETPTQGKVMSLPAGSCVWDAVKQGQESFGFHARDAGIQLNGAYTSVTRQLHNGDILTIPSAVTA